MPQFLFIGEQPRLGHSNGHHRDIPSRWKDGLEGSRNLIKASTAPVTISIPVHHYQIEHDTFTGHCPKLVYDRSTRWRSQSTQIWISDIDIDHKTSGDVFNLRHDTAVTDSLAQKQHTQRHADSSTVCAPGGVDKYGRMSSFVTGTSPGSLARQVPTIGRSLSVCA